MKKTLFFICYLCFSVLYGFSQSSEAYYLMLKALYKNTVPVASMEAATKALAGKTIWLDAREWQEYQVSHISGARWVGYNNFRISAIQDIPKETPIIVYCSVGYRSERIGEKLQAAGYKNVNNLYGGIFEWVNQGKAIIDAKGKATQKVHGYDKTWGAWITKGKVVY